MPEEADAQPQKSKFEALLDDFFEDKNLKNNLWYMFNLAVQSPEFIKLSSEDRGLLVLQHQILIENIEKLEKFKNAV